MAQWIWLPKLQYPNAQITRFDFWSGKPKDPYTVAEFQRECAFEKPIKKVKLRFSV